MFEELVLVRILRGTVSDIEVQVVVFHGLLVGGYPGGTRPGGGCQNSEDGHR